MWDQTSMKMLPTVACPQHQMYNTGIFAFAPCCPAWTSSRYVDLSELKSVAEVQRKVKEHADSNPDLPWVVSKATVHTRALHFDVTDTDHAGDWSSKT